MGSHFADSTGNLKQPDSDLPERTGSVQLVMRTLPDSPNRCVIVKTIQWHFSLDHSEKGGSVQVKFRECKDSGLYRYHDGGVECTRLLLQR
jgi:hypothetical protein